MSHTQDDADILTQDTVDQTATHLPTPPCCVCLDLNVSEEKWFSSAAPDVWRKSALECESCAVVWRAVEPFLSKAKNFCRLDDVLGIQIFLGQCGSLSFEIQYGPPPGTFHTCEIRCDKDGICPWPSIKPACFGLSNAKFASSRILQWMKQCEGHLDACNRGLEVQELPTRVIEIESPGRVRLVATDESQRARYACLSHCWGDIEILRTTKSTYLDFQKAIPWNDLPLTFRHALEVTFYTGIWYLWIDSLCIVQDDSADWRHEGSKMASIYAKSYFTLAAVAARNAHDGLYRRSHENHYFEHSMQRQSDQAAYKLYVHPHYNHGQSLAQEMPLFERAWFHQERLLSNRVHFFGSEELFWECRESRCCECGGIPGTDPPKSKVPNDIHGWQSLVTEYTKLRLTFEKDRLPALQGLAKAWQQKLQSRYLAGLWKEYLPKQLLWSVHETHQRPKIYLGPSWSWVSVNGPVFWDSYHNQRHHKAVSIISVSTTLVGKDPMGEIASGELVLEGRCMRATTEHYDVQPESPMFGEPPEEWSPDVDLPRTNNVFLVEIIRPVHPFNSTWCLVLRQKPGQNAAYERIGCMDPSDNLVDWFENYAEEMVVTVV